MERGPLLEHNANSIRISSARSIRHPYETRRMNTRRQKATARADGAGFPLLSPESRVMIATLLLTVALDCGFASGLPQLGEAWASLRSGGGTTSASIRSLWMSLFLIIQGAVFEPSLLHVGRFHACLEPFCCVVQSRHLELIGCKPNGSASFLRPEFAFQFGREVSERCEFCSKQFANLALFSLADQQNIGDISRQLFVVEFPNDLVDISYRAFQVVRGRNRSAFHGVEALLF